MPTVNRWAEPSGPETIERGDYVQHARGTTTGYVIGVRGTGTPNDHDLVHIVLDGPCSYRPGGRARHEAEIQCFLEQFPRGDLKIVKKGVK
jgi:hypothetical protein